MCFVRGGFSKGCILVLDIEELEILGASEIRARRLNAKEVITPKSGNPFMFSVANGKVKLFRRDQVLRPSTWIQDYPQRVEEREDLRGESDRSQPVDSFPDDSDAWNDFSSISQSL